MTGETIVFRSAVDLWFYLVIFTTAASLLVLGFITAQLSSTAFVILIVVGVVSVGLPVWFLINTTYTISADTLHIRSGPFSWVVPRAGITSIQPSRSPISSPALSLDRIEIRYGAGQMVLVSPIDKEGFTAALKGHSGAAL